MKIFDNSHLNKKTKIIAGVDEAGRGPLAGPVVAAVVIYDNITFNDEIIDSKKLSEKKRERLFYWIIKNAKDYGIGIVDQKRIDEINILQATFSAMKIALTKLRIKPDLILIDGNKSFEYDVPIKSIVKGDSKSFSIASASIIAKVTRDRIMKDLHSDYSVYGWDKNKGYGTKAHFDAIKKFGISPIHRKTFLKNILME